MDTRANARRFVNLLRPTVVFFVKYDFWFNYLEQLRQREIATVIFSAIFRPNQYFFKPYGRWFLKSLGQCFTHIFVQNEESMQLLKSHGIDSVSIAGDTRFDRVHAIAQESCRFTEVEDFLGQHPGNKVLLAGSSWEPDETNIKKFYDHYGERLTLILAPHVTSESHINAIVNLFGKSNCTRYTQMTQRVAGSRILIVDTIGILSSLYRYADVAYIGGGFGRGIHNTLEAITFGKPVVFGPNYQKFKEAKDIIALGGGFSYCQYPQLQQILDRLLNDKEQYDKSAQVCTQYLDENLGSADKILSVVNGFIKKM
jgi:3-deoxy-D-manno-octulosonic-acid transferase